MAGTSAVPRNACRRPRVRRRRPASGSHSRATSSSSEAAHPSSARTTQAPRGTSAAPTPARFNAVLPPAARAIVRSWACTSRTRPAAPPGSATIRSPGAIPSPQSVPVTTVPAPGSENDRSTNRRGRPPAVRLCRRPASRSSAARTRSTPSPVTAETGTISGPAPTRSRASAAAASGGARSARVTATTPSPTPEQAQHRQVLLRLRHDAVVGGDAEQVAVDTARPGDHVAHEALVARDVDQAHRAARRQAERREAELDRDAAGLLGRQAVRVAPRQGEDQRGLAVVDVPGGPEDERLGHGRARATSAGRRPSSSSSSASTSSSTRPSRSRGATAGSPSRRARASAPGSGASSATA